MLDPVFTPLAGQPDIYVATLSFDGRSAAALVYPTPDGEAWTYDVAGDVSYRSAARLSTSEGACRSAGVRLCALLAAVGDDPDDGEDLPHWPGDGPASWRDDEDRFVVDGCGDVIYGHRRCGCCGAINSHIPTCPSLPRPPLRVRLVGMWKAWRL